MSTTLFQLAPTDTHNWEFGRLGDDVKFPESSFLGFYFLGDASRWVAHVPQWFVIMVAFTLAATPWVRWSKRFSLRSLLIVMTLVAVAMGLVVWAVRAG